MKANEFMLGNFASVYPSMMPIKIAAIHKDKVAYRATTKKLEWVKMDLLRPIPITPEILEKNGFRKSVSPLGIHAKCYEIDNKNKKYHLTIANYNKYKRLLLNVDSEDSECFNIKCDYVHQLQQALNICRIKKEIEL